MEITPEPSDAERAAIEAALEDEEKEKAVAASVTAPWAEPFSPHVGGVHSL
jgi:hypothetical protein